MVWRSPHGGMVWRSPHGGMVWRSPHGGMVWRSPHGGMVWRSPHGGMVWRSPHGGMVWRSPHGGMVWRSPHGGTIGLRSVGHARARPAGGIHRSRGQAQVACSRFAGVRRPPPPGRVALQETKTVRASATDVRRMNRKINKLTAQGWRVISTTQGALGLMTITLVRDRLPPTPVAVQRIRGECRHGEVFAADAQVKVIFRCRDCGDVVKSSSVLFPSDVNPTSAAGLKTWLDSCPPGDELAGFVRAAVGNSLQ